MKNKKSFFERLTGTVNTEFEDEFEDIVVNAEGDQDTSMLEERVQLPSMSNNLTRDDAPAQMMTNIRPIIQQTPMRQQQIQQMPLSQAPQRSEWLDDNSLSGASSSAQQEETIGQLPVDVYQTNDDIIIKTLVPGVRPENLEVNVTRDMVVIKGKREQAKQIPPENYFHQELYWGVFQRSILLPQEIDTDQAEAVEHNGLLILRLPRINKAKQTKLKIRSA